MNTRKNGYQLLMFLTPKGYHICAPKGCGHCALAHMPIYYPKSIVYHRVTIVNVAPYTIRVSRFWLRTCSWIAHMGFFFQKHILWNTNSENIWRHKIKNSRRTVYNKDIFLKNVIGNNRVQILVFASLFGYCPNGYEFYVSDEKSY